MKKKIIKTISIFVVLILLLESCTKNVSIITPDISIAAEGIVLDRETNIGIPDVIIQVVGFGEFKTDFTGQYKIDNIPVGEYVVIATKDNFIGGGGEITVTEVSINANPIYLVSLAPIITIDNDGGEIIVSDLPNETIKLEIPEGALEVPTGISLTQLKGVDIMGEFQENYLSISTVISNQTGLPLRKPCEFTFTMPYKLDPGTQIPLFVLNGNGKWEQTETHAIVNESGLNAIAIIEELNSYSIAVKTEFNEHFIDGTKIVIDLPLDATSVSFPFNDSLVSHISPYENYNKNIVKQMIEQSYGVTFNKIHYFNSTFPSALEMTEQTGLSGVWGIEKKSQNLNLSLNMQFEHKNLSLIVADPVTVIIIVVIIIIIWPSTAHAPGPHDQGGNP
jgi:hypothetical protein